jgi:hypothetical protein
MMRPVIRRDLIGDDSPGRRHLAVPATDNSPERMLNDFGRVLSSPFKSYR